MAGLSWNPIKQITLRTIQKSAGVSWEGFLVACLCQLMPPLREAASIPDVPGRTFVPRGRRGVGEPFVQEQRRIVSAAAVRRRGGGSGALSEALQGCIDSSISLEISPVMRVLCGSCAGDKICFYCVQILSGEYLIWFP